MDSKPEFIVSGYVSEKETIEFFNEGLLQASSAARQLAKAQKHEIWKDISILCDQIHNTGIHLAKSKPLSRQQTLQILDRREAAMSNKMDDNRPVAKPKFLLN